MRVPQLRKHSSGHYFVRWGGRDRYLGKVKKHAEKLYLDSLEHWRRWRVAKRVSQQEAAGRPRITVDALAERFLDAKRLERGGDCEYRYRKHLARFRTMYGDFDADTIRPMHLQMIKSTLAGKLAPRTINHDITTTKVMFNWASGLDLVSPVSFVGVKLIPVGPVGDQALGPAEFVAAFRRAPDYLQPWLAVNYLGLLRPSETIRVILGQGEWHSGIPGIFILDRGKVDDRSSIRRHCILSDRALWWLRQAEQRYARLDSYSQAVRDQCRIGPKVIQKTAAARLVLRHNVPPESVELLLGHIKSRLSVTYYLPHFKRLRQISGRLAIR